MAWVAVDKDGTEHIFNDIPKRGYCVFRSINKYRADIKRILLPKGSIKKLIGRELTWENNPVELKADTVEKITIDVEDYCRYLSYANYIENWAGTIYKCPRCGALNPEGYNCMECGYMKLSYE